MAAAVSASMAAVLMHRLPATKTAAVFSRLPNRPYLSSAPLKEFKGGSLYLVIKLDSMRGRFKKHFCLLYMAVKSGSNFLRLPVPLKSFSSRVETGSAWSSQLLVKASSSDESSLDANELFDDLKQKWDAVENKTTVIIYGGGAVVALWLTAVIVGAINSVPLLPKILELIGLGYTAWFVYRYLLFKSSRKELVTDIDALKKKIAGTE